MDGRHMGLSGSAPNWRKRCNSSSSFASFAWRIFFSSACSARKANTSLEYTWHRVVHLLTNERKDCTIICCDCMFKWKWSRRRWIIKTKPKHTIATYYVRILVCVCALARAPIQCDTLSATTSSSSVFANRFKYTHQAIGFGFGFDVKLQFFYRPWFDGRALTRHPTNRRFSILSKCIAF